MNKKAGSAALSNLEPPLGNPQVPAAQSLAKLVYWIRGEKVMLDADLAAVYGVETGALNRAVKRNTDRFPADFMFQLGDGEWGNLKC